MCDSVLVEGGKSMISALRWESQFAGQILQGTAAALLGSHIASSGKSTSSASNTNMIK